MAAVQDKQKIDLNASLALADDMVKAAKRLLFEMAEAAEEDREYEACTEIKMLIEAAELSVRERDEKAQSLAREALLAAKQGKSTILQQDEARIPRIKRAISEMMATVAQADDDQTLLDEEIHVSLKQAILSLQEGRLDDAEHTVATLNTMLSRARAGAAQKEESAKQVEERLATLEGLSQEWGVQMAYGTLRYIAEQMPTDDPSAMADILQRMISASLLTGKPLTQDLVAEVFREIKDE